MARSWSVRHVGQGLGALSALALCGTALGNAGVQLPLSQYQAGTETTTPVPNGDFEAGSSGWTPSGNIITAAPIFSNTANTGSLTAQMNDSASPASFTQTLSTPLTADANYVLSTYIWNAGRYDTSGFGGGDLATVKLIDPGNGFNNISITLEGNGADGAAGTGGYFAYIMANEAQLRAWSGIQVQAIGEEGTIAGALPANWAQFDNISLTPAESFAGHNWKSAAGGNWGDGANWLGNLVPNAKGAVATLGDAIGSTPATINVDNPITVGEINFNSPTSYAVSGANAITLDVTLDGFGVQQGVPEISAAAGSHTISAPVSLGRSSILNAANGATLTLSGPVTAAAGTTINKTGAGLVQISNVRADGADVKAGTLKVLPDGTDAGVSVVKSLTIAGGTDAWTARLDLANNSMVVDYDPAGPSPLATIANQIKSGYAGGAWTGNGISSSAAAAAASSAHKTALGYGESPGTGTFKGQSVDGSAVLVRYTYTGDANLDGTVDTLDFNSLAANFGGSGKIWTQADFNYDGTVDTLDFNNLAANFGQSLPGGTGGAVGTLVPEPSSLFLLGSAAGILVAGNRRRRSKR